MNAPEPQPSVPPPSHRFQFSLRTLLLLFVVLGSSLAVFGAWGIVVFALIVGLAVYVHQAESLPSWAELVLVVIVFVFFVGMLLAAAQPVRESARSALCLNNLKEIVQALHAYHQANGCFPPAYIADKSGKPMHSWRVLILPYLDQNALHKLYDPTQPWNGPKNKMVSNRPIMVYLCPSDPNGRASHFTQSSYVAVVGPDTAWAGEKPRKLTDFGKDASNTIMLIEVTNSGISWAEPRDLLLDALGAANGKSPALALPSDHGLREEFFFTYDHAAGVHVAMADGSVRSLRIGNRSPEELRKLLQVGGFKEEEFGDPERRLNWPNIAALTVWLLSVGTLLTHAVRSRKSLSIPPPSPAR